MEKKYIVCTTSAPGKAESWYKNDGVPMTFDSLDEARLYANHLNDKIASQKVRYYPKEIEPDMLMPIRSAVHSNYVGMVAMVGADDRVYLGKEDNYHFVSEKSYYDNRDNSLCPITDRTDMYYFLYGEGWVHSQEDMLKRGLMAAQYDEFARLREGVLRQFTVQREILFAGKPFQPENYLRNAELYEESQTGNYNMLDGQINNEPPAKPDLTDGQTYEEIRELAPETLHDEKPSVLELLKSGQPEQEPWTPASPCEERTL